MLEQHVVAIYEFPSPLLLTAPCSGHEVQGAINGDLFTVALPRVDERASRTGVFQPEALDGLGAQVIDGLRESTLQDMQHVGVPWEQCWGYASAANDDNDWHAFALLLASASGASADDLVHAFDLWASRLRSWIEAFVDQDAGLHGALNRVSVAGEGLHALDVVEGMAPDTAGPFIELDFTDADEPLGLGHWEKAIEQASRGISPPDALALLADARSFLRRKHHRRAVLDAATAAELALSEALSRLLQGMADGRVRQQIEGEPRSLGRLVDVLKPALPLPDGLVQGLATIRNKAIHSNFTPSRDQAIRAVQLAQETVTAAT